MNRLPATRSLSELIPTGREGGSEFARIVDLLLFYESRHNGGTINLFSDRSGDWNGLDSFGSPDLRKRGKTGFQYKFFPSPLSNQHRTEIENSLKKARGGHKESKITKWIVVTPDDLIESSTKKGGGDVSWFNGLTKRLALPFKIEHWGHTKLQGLFLRSSELCLYYYPELVVDGMARKTAIATIREQYNSVLHNKFGRIEFVGMSVRKEEASRGVRISDIYIPLTTVAEGTEPTDQVSPRTNPLDFLSPGRRSMILGDPGSGKSTLLRFLALVGQNSDLQARCGAKGDNRLPILVTLRLYADELKSNFNLPIVDFIVRTLQAEFSNPDITVDFLRFYLETGQAILLFDGVDELPDTRFKLTVRDRVQALAVAFPGNSIIVTSRIVGYEAEARFAGDCPFDHSQVAPLREPEIRQFCYEWHAARVDDIRERGRMVEDLMAVLSDPDNHAIHELACNPLLLTIIVLVHRIDAVLPDQRVLLYQKCVETLLITWHTWKYRASAPKKPDREDRRNLRRMEAIAEWMHNRAGLDGREQRAVAPFDDLVSMLSAHIREIERWPADKGEPEDEAADFLSFVRQKAGLLVEAGPELYSFVHLTFQEYLAARHIITRSEARGGDTFVWQVLKDRIDQPRWNEVARLLVAARDSEESQRNLIGRILGAADAEHSVTISALVGGLLLDRVPAAEERRSDILCSILISIGANPNEALILIPTLCTLSTRPDNVASILASMSRAWESLSGRDQRLALVLAACVTPLPGPDLAPWLSKLQEEGRENASLANFLLLDDVSIEMASSDRWRGLAQLAMRLAFSQPETNAVAAALCSTYPDPLSVILGLQLACFLSSGPFEDFTANILILFDFNKRIEHPWWITNPEGSRKNKQDTRAEARQLARELIESIVGSIEVIRKRSRSDEMSDVLDSMRRNESLSGTLYRAIHERDGTQERDSKFFWSELEKNKAIQDDLLNALVSGLRLKPGPIWWEAIRTRLIPRLAQRRLFLKSDPVTELRLNPTDGSTQKLVAVWLMIDTWLYLNNGYDQIEDSPMASLANASREVSDPIVKFFYLFRATVQGDRQAGERLRSLLKSPSRPLYEILALAGWVEGGRSANQSLRRHGRGRRSPPAG